MNHARRTTGGAWYLFGIEKASACPLLVPKSRRAGVEIESKEYGIFGWSGQWDGVRGDSLSDDSKEGMKIGDRIRIWPNQACIAGAGFGWYFIVDSP